MPMRLFRLASRQEDCELRLRIDLFLLTADTDGAPDDTYCQQRAPTSISVHRHECTATI